MLDLPANLIAEKNKLSGTAPWILLLEITLTDDDSAGPTILRICNNNEDVTFDGDVYTKFNFRMGIVESGIEGAIPTVKLQVSNVTKFLQSYLNDLDGGLESTVKMILVNTDHLTEDYSELEMNFTVMGCTAGPYWVEWTLGMVNPLNSRFPQYRYLANHCPWEFADGVECGYVGVESTCNHTLSDCVERNNAANFGGRLGMKSGGLQIA
jgi:phage-related protein